jgi:hypothetical protein
MKAYRRRPLPAKLVLLAAGSVPLFVQLAVEPQKQLPAPAVNFTQEQDQKDMLGQLGIKALRPGPGGNEADPFVQSLSSTCAKPSLGKNNSKAGDAKRRPCTDPGDGR